MIGSIVLMLVVATIAYATRAAGLILGRRRSTEGRGKKGRITVAWNRFLAYVPVAIFAALLVPDLGVGTADMLPRLAGATLAAVVVLRFGYLWVGLASGMAAYWMVGGIVSLAAA